MKRTLPPCSSEIGRPRKRGTSRLFVLGAAFASSTAGLAASGARPAQVGLRLHEPPELALRAGVGQADLRPGTFRFDIPAGPLGEVIQRFQQLTQVKITIGAAGIEQVQSPGVSGEMTTRDALTKMLSGTNVSFDITADGVTLGVRAPTEFVAVNGEAIAVPSSPKYTAPLRDTPQTMVIIPQQLFEQQGAVSLREVLRNTPGITMSIGEGGSGGTSSGDNLLIRGFSARNDIYIDGARDPGLVNRDMFNTESVEVAKGPTSVTGGRGVTGGSINLVTKSAGSVDTTNVRVTGGSANYGRATFDVNHRMTDTVAFRLNGMWQNTGYPGRDVAKYKSWGLAPSLALGLGKPTQVTLNYSRMKQDNVPDWGLPTLLPDSAIAQGLTVNDLDFSNFYGIASRDYEKTTSDIATATVSHKLSATLSLRNLTRYGKNFRDAVLTPPRPATAATGQGPEDPGYDALVPQLRRTDTKYQHRNDRVVTNQTDVAADFGTGGIQHNADIGLEVARDHQPTYAFTDLFTNGRPPVDDLLHPTPLVAYTPAYGRTGATSDAHAASTGLYAFDTVRISEHWQADLGLRWDRIRVDYKSVAPTGVLSNFGRIDRAVSGRSGIVYKPAEEGSIYAAYSTSFTPSFDGTLGLTLAAAGVNNQALPPERSHNVEVGTKWELFHKVQLTAAVFDMEKTNAKTTDLNGATVLAGDQQVKGVELSLNGNLTERWGAFGGLSLMDGKVKASGVATEVGAQLPYVPKASLNLWSTYRLPMGLTLGGGTNYSNGNYFNQTGGFLFVAGGTAPNPKYVKNAAAVQALTKYWVFNAALMYPLNKHIQLQLNATNLGNEKYADRAYDRHFLPGPARQVLFSPVITW